MINRKNRIKPAPIRFEDAVASGMLRVVTDPVERAKLEAKERAEIARKNHTDCSEIHDRYKYCDRTYFADGYTI